MNTAPSIGVIGVGLVGTVLANHLSQAGYHVVGFDSQPKQEGSSFCLSDSARTVCDRCQTIFLSLPHSGIVDAVLEEVEDALTSSHLLIDTTTGDPEDAEKHQAQLARRGAQLIEATIAGSSDLLRQRQAGLFLGGSSEAIARAQELFDLLSDQCVHVGDVGAASRFKLVFNLVLGLHRAVLAEALHFAELLGFDATQTLDILSHSPAASGVMQTKGRKMLQADYEPPQARLRQHLKDVRIMLEMAERAGSQIPLSQTHRTLLERAEALGFGTSDTSAIREAYRPKASADS